jgi:hypothetical protein
MEATYIFLVDLGDYPYYETIRASSYDPEKSQKVSFQGPWEKW